MDTDSSYWLIFLFIALLILLNGLFAAAEIAVVATRKSRLKQLAEEGQERAKILLSFKENPDRFLATIQIAITFVGVLASAIGGATIAIQVIKPAIEKIPIGFISASSEAISIGIV
ncbi:MAG: CNNM domain-containing protein, partial [Thermodesulfovibrionales bacterium]